MRASLAEQWFVEDALEELDKVCPLCQSQMRKRLALFGATDREALSQVYQLSRDLRIKRLFVGDLVDARQTDDWEVLRVMLVIADMSGAAFLAERKPELLMEAA